jgi:ubiquitin C-terminal hydrolase
MNVLNKIFTPLWVNGDKFFIPNELKALMANSISQFNNSNQQDSHELLLYILDMIHEDTNQAPIQLGNSRYYDECLPKMDNESDISASKRFWKYYKDRNNSIIVDLFTGQLKNTIQCFACNNKSVIFEPFVTLPLAIPIMKRVDVIVVPAINIKSTIKLTIYVSESALFIDLTTYLKKYLSPEMKVERFRTLLVNGRSHTSKFTKNTENIYTMSRKGFIFCYEIDEAIAEGEDYYPFITLVREFKNIIVEKPEEKLNKDEDITSLSQNFKVSCELPNESITKINSQIDDKGNFSFPRLFPVPPLSTIKELRQSLYGYMRKFFEPSHMINEKILSNKYRDFVENYKITKSVDESEYNQIIHEEYNFFFSQNQISIKDKKSDDEISKLKEEFLDTLPFRVMLISTKDEIKTKPKLFFSGKYEDFSKTLPDNAKIEKLIDIIKAGFKLVIEVKNREEIKLRMNQIISIINKDKEIDFTKIPTIYDCLDHFSLYEKLDKGNEWYCSQCRKLQSSYKKIDIFYVPKNLIVVFNRFETKMLSKFQIQLLKNSNFVKYPVNGLNLWDFVQGAKDPKPTYDLYSVSQHSGSTEGGHHATACRNFGKWYEFDDTSIFPSEENLIVSPEGYVLFYRRQDKKN